MVLDDNVSGLEKLRPMQYFSIFDAKLVNLLGLTWG
jgi:hypothetical protein